MFSLKEQFSNGLGTHLFFLSGGKEAKFWIVNLLYTFSGYNSLVPYLLYLFNHEIYNNSNMKFITIVTIRVLMSVKCGSNLGSTIY